MRARVSLFSVVYLGGGLTKIGASLIDPALAEVAALGDRRTPLGLAALLVDRWQERTRMSDLERHAGAGRVVETL